MDLTFGEQIKVLLNREHMTIKEFAELVEARTGTPCSRQNLTQKLKRDNFQEQDMRTLAAVLGCRVTISLTPANEEEIAQELGLFVKPAIASSIPAAKTPDVSEQMSETIRTSRETGSKKANGSSTVKIRQKVTELLPPDCINPYTKEEYLTNTVRPHPELPHYIQVYDQAEHAWTDVAEDYFLKFQEQKKLMMGKDYSLPIYI